MNELPAAALTTAGPGGLPPFALWAALAVVAVLWLLTFMNRRRAALLRAEDEIAHLEQEIGGLRDAAHAALTARDVAEARLSERDRTLEKLEQSRDIARAEADDRIDDLTERATIAEREVTAVRIQLEQERIAAAEKIALLEELREEMSRNFKELADASLKATSEELSRANAERLDHTLSPLREHVAQFQNELRNVHEGALRDRQALKTEIEQLTRRSEEVSKEATALARALKGDKQRQGAWGEMILESLLERSGLRKDEEYLTQTSHTTEEGQRLRTDVIVRMPNDTCLVIDSKVSLVDYEIAVNSDDEAEATAARKRHAIAMRRHIDTLKGKTYQTVAGQSVDYVIMFVPIEGALSEALREAGDLTSYALDANVTIATPTTLMMALRTVASFWTIDRRNRNAEAIADRAGKLYDKVAGFVDEMEKVGRALGTARGSFDTAMDRLSRGRGNVLAQVDQLRELGARTTKRMGGDFDPLPMPLPEAHTQALAAPVSLPESPAPLAEITASAPAAPQDLASEDIAPEPTNPVREAVRNRMAQRAEGPPLTKDVLTRPVPLTLTQPIVDAPVANGAVADGPAADVVPADPIMPTTVARSKPLNLPQESATEDTPVENLFASDEPTQSPRVEMPVLRADPVLRAEKPAPSKTSEAIASAVQKAMQNGRPPLRIMRQDPPLRSPASERDDAAPQTE